MPGWFEQQGIDGYVPYEQGGVTGGNAGGYQADPSNYANPVQQAHDVATAAGTPPLADGPAAFNPNQQVGHNGTINGMNREQYRDAWMGSAPKSMDDLRAFVAQHGGTVQSDNGTVTTPFGETLDLGGNARGSAAGHGAFSATWGGVGGAPGGPGDGASMPNGFGGPGGGGSFALNYSGAGSGGGARPSFEPLKYEEFVAPDPSKVADDPATKFKMQYGMDALQRSAASKSRLLSGNTLRDITDYAQGLANSGYGDVFNRALNVNQANNQGRQGAFSANTGADIGYMNAATSRDVGMGNIGLGYHNADQSYDLGLRNNALGYTQAANSYALGQGNLGLGWANHGLNADQQQFFQNYQFPVSTGLSAAQTLGGYGSTYGANGANTIMGGGNAAAAGTMGRANAYGGALNTVGNVALNGYYASQYGHN